jgi:hypothetical protein|tara:strand:- start:785 stop:1498 length:714 start_codon:yes stop_codon:yes gene_type:complete
MLKSSKKGSHVGLVLSFVIFVTFLIFVFTVLNPAVSEERGKGLELGLVKESLINNLTSDLSVTSLKVLDSTEYGKDCFQIDNIFGENVKIKDENNEHIEGSSSEIDNKISISHNQKNFFRIFYSAGFLSGAGRGVGECDVLEVSNYTIGSTKVNDYIFEEDVYQMFELYENNYFMLKENLGISLDNNFGFGFINSSGFEDVRGFEEVSGNVYIEEIPLQYYDSEANVKSGSIKVRVW